MEVKVIGVDIAKRYFQVHGINSSGEAVLRRKLTRDLFLKLFSGLPSCLVGIEAGSGAHHWARELTKLGHDVRLMAPQFVRPYVNSRPNETCTGAESAVQPKGLAKGQVLMTRECLREAIDVGQGGTVRRVPLLKRQGSGMSLRLQTMGWMRALLAFLVAITLLVAPVAGAWAMPCYDLVRQEQATVVESGELQAAIRGDGLQGHSHAVGHTLWCSSACASCVVALAAPGPTVPKRIVLAARYAQRDEIVTGLAFPPTLGPPRTRT